MRDVNTLCKLLTTSAAYLGLVDNDPLGNHKCAEAVRCSEGKQASVGRSSASDAVREQLQREDRSSNCCALGVFVAA